MIPKQDFCHSTVCLVPASEIPLDITIQWCGHQRTSSREYFWDGMRRGSHELILWQYTISGCGEVRLGGKSFPVPPGEAFLLKIPEKHLYYLPESSPDWEFLFFAFKGREAVRLAEAVRERAGAVSSSYASARTVELAWEILRTCMENPCLSAAETSAKAYSFIMSLLSGVSAVPGGYGDSFVRKMHLYFLAHLAQHIPVEKAAAFAGYSRSHFCRLFREYTGKGMHEYLLELRVNMALHKLQNENLSVKEACNACGFEDSGYFCKVFRKFFGTTPMRFCRSRMEKITEN